MPDRMERHTSLHLWLTLLVALAVVAGVGATLIVGRNNPGASDTDASHLLDGGTRISTLDAAGLICPADAAFSPDGSRIVVLGLLASAATAHACPERTDDTVAPTAAAILDSTTGRLVRSIPLDPLVRGSAAASQSELEHVVYSGLGWSPDGRHVALVFTVFGDGDVAPENVLDSGLLLLDTTAGTGVVLRGDSGFFAGASGVSSGFPVWHLTQQIELPSFLPQSGLAYAWGADGDPYPILPLGKDLDQLPNSAAARYPVGMPDGGPHYTIWQPGLVIDTGGIDSRQVDFVSAFPAWSPDGVNLTLMVAGVALRDTTAGDSMARTTTMREQLAADATTPPIPSPPALPVVPARDAALAAVQQKVHSLGWTLVAWNPSGSLLGSVDCFATGDQQMDLRDTATGQVLASVTLDLPEGDPGCRDGSNAAVVGAYPSLGLSLAWSPSGDRMLLGDRVGNALTLYHVHQPPNS